MANARKCDRCEKCFDPFHSKGLMCTFRNPFFQSSNDIREGVVGKLMFDDSPEAYVDLCPDCAEMFEAFMCGAEPQNPAPRMQSFWDLVEKICFGKTEEEVSEMIEEAEKKTRGDEDE